MKLSGSQFNDASVRIIAVAVLAVTLAFAPGSVGAADSDAHQDRAEARIKQMHAKLKITPVEEAQWSQVAQAMRDNAKTMDNLTQARSAQGKSMSAIDDLKSYGEITEAHAAGIRKLTPAFAALYVSMSEAQQKEADTLFFPLDLRR